MTASAAERGYGATIAVTGHTGFYEVVDISDFGSTVADIDVTSHDSDNSGNEYIAGLLEGGELTFTGNYVTTDTSGQTWAIETNFRDGSNNEFTLTLPNTAASTFVFNAHVKAYKMKVDLKGAIKYTITLKITGKPTFTV